MCSNSQQQQADSCLATAALLCCNQEMHSHHAALLNSSAGCGRQAAAHAQPLPAVPCSSNLQAPCQQINMHNMELRDRTQHTNKGGTQTVAAAAAASACYNCTHCSSEQYCTTCLQQQSALSHSRHASLPEPFGWVITTSINDCLVGLPECAYIPLDLSCCAHPVEARF